MSTDTIIWSQLEEFAKRKYPDYVKESLLKCGYDSFESLGMICDESITDMEDYLKTKFLPAHKDFIINIPEQIEKMDAKAKSEECKRQKKTASDKPLSSRKQSKKIKEGKVTDSDKPLSSRTQPKTIKEGKVKCKSNRASQGLKSQLLDKIRKYVISNDIIADKAPMTKDNVIGLKRCGATDKFLYECYFKCPVCEKSSSVKCKLNKSWDTKNIYSHLNKYHKRDQVRSSSASSTESKVFSEFIKSVYSTPLIKSVHSMHPTAGPSSMKYLSFK